MLQGVVCTTLFRRDITSFLLYDAFSFFYDASSSAGPLKISSPGFERD
jgi:hypothetical protein